MTIAQDIQFGGVLDEWLASIGPRAFRADYFRRMPLACPGTAARAATRLTWKTVAELLASKPRPDMLIVRDGQLDPTREPSSIEGVQSNFAHGYSTVLRGCEDHHEGLRALADELVQDVAGEATVHVFLTPGGGHRSFGWHYDCEDVFIVQARGAKEYSLRQNTVNPEPVLSAMPKDMQYERETSALKMTCTLAAGDWLYIPRGWWHVARGIADSFSISIGILGEDARGA